MSIDPGYISSQPITEDVETTIQLLASRPSITEIIDPPKAAGLIVGFFNGAIDVVELYIVSADGRRYIRIS